MNACEGTCCSGVHTSFLFALFGDYRKRFFPVGCSTPAEDFFQIPQFMFIFTTRLASERSVNLVRQRNYKMGTMHSVKRAWSSLIIAVCTAVASAGWLHLQPREIMVEIFQAT